MLDILIYFWLNYLQQVFKTYDQDASGHIEEHELTQGSFFNLNPKN